MKKYFAALLVVMGTTAASSQNNDGPEFSGENFSLEGAIALLKKANTLEQFEEAINNEKNDVNNLDLNNDGNTDYITVEDIMEEDKHVIVLTALR
jgi:biopolymer transport protein ExbD